MFKMYNYVLARQYVQSMSMSMEDLHNIHAYSTLHKMMKVSGKANGLFQYFFRRKSFPFSTENHFCPFRLTEKCSSQKFCFKKGPVRNILPLIKMNIYGFLTFLIFTILV